MIVVLAAAGLAAVSPIAGAWNRAGNVRELRRAPLVDMEDAIACQDLPAAFRSWREARELALHTRGWQSAVETAVAERRLAGVDATYASTSAARELYLVALFRARAEGSVDGALAAADGFAQLGDRDATRGALRIAAGLAARTGDSGAAERVLNARERLLVGRLADSDVASIPRS
jgi:hypothetical protein